MQQPEMLLIRIRHVGVSSFWYRKQITGGPSDGFLGGAEQLLDI